MTQHNSDRATPEPTPTQRYEDEIRAAIAEWAEEALELLAQKLTTIDTLPGAQPIEPRTSEAALLRRLEAIGRDAINNWIKTPVARAAKVPHPHVPTEYETQRADQRKRNEKEHTRTVDVRDLINQDRRLEGKPPLQVDDPSGMHGSQETARVPKTARD